MKDHVGVNNPHSRLNDRMVREIRLEYKRGVRAVELAVRYGISVAMVYKILSGERWGHVTWTS